MLVAIAILISFAVGTMYGYELKTTEYEALEEEHQIDE